MAKMYDYALDKIGMDVTAYNIYADYIAFLRQVPTNVQQELQKMSAIRKVGDFWWRKNGKMPIL